LTLVGAWIEADGALLTGWWFVVTVKVFGFWLFCTDPDVFKFAEGAGLTLVWPTPLSLLPLLVLIPVLVLTANGLTAAL